MNKTNLIKKIKLLIKEENVPEYEPCYDDHGEFFERGKVEAYRDILDLLEE